MDDIVRCLIPGERLGESRLKNKSDLDLYILLY